MLNQSQKKNLCVDVGRTVRVSIPDVDRSKGDSRNILAVVMSNEKGMYQLGCRTGILNGLYTVNQFTVCQENFIQIKEVPTNNTSVRTASNKMSVVGGQGFLRCNCKSCDSQKCSCKKAGVMCNSKCHMSLSCKNK